MKCPRNSRHWIGNPRIRGEQDISMQWIIDASSISQLEERIPGPMQRKRISSPRDPDPWRGYPEKSETLFGVFLGMLRRTGMKVIQIYEYNI